MNNYQNYTPYNNNTSDWRCENCGRINRSDARFCRNCGAPKPMDISSRFTGEFDNDRSRIAEMPQKQTNATMMIVLALAIALVLALATFFVVKMIAEKKAQGEPAPRQEQSQSIDNDSDARNDSAGNDVQNDIDNNNSQNDFNNNNNQGTVIEEDEDSYYKVGDSYFVQDVIVVRYGPGKEYDQMLRDELAPAEYALSVDYKDEPEPASLKKGSRIICQGMSEDGKWMALTEGWVCVYDNGEWLVR